MLTTILQVHLDFRSRSQQTAPLRPNCICPRTGLDLFQNILAQPPHFVPRFIHSTLAPSNTGRNFGSMESPRCFTGRRERASYWCQQHLQGCYTPGAGTGTARASRPEPLVREERLGQGCCTILQAKRDHVPVRRIKFVFPRKMPLSARVDHSGL